MKNSMKKLISLTTCMVLSVSLLSGCGKKKEQLPALKEPAVMTEWYYPAFEYEIGTPLACLGKVQCDTIPQAFDITVKIESVQVSIGDKVKKGDVIATVDASDSQSKLDGLYTQIKGENTNYEYITKEYNNTKKTINNQIAEAKKQGADAKQLAGLNSQLGVADENYRYETILHEKRLSELKSETKGLEKIVENKALYASCDGVISYLNMNGGYTVTVGENAASIQCVNDKYITPINYNVLNATMDEEYEKHIKKVVIDGKEIDAKEVTYTPEEYAQAKLKPDSVRLPYRLKCEGIDDMSIGQNAIIRLYPELTHSEKTILAESLYEMEGDAIYVKGASGTPEKRFVTLGARDDHYVQILDGLNDGDLVYNSTYTTVPSVGGANGVVVKDFLIDNHTIGYWPVNAMPQLYECGAQGIITKVSDKYVKGAKVNKGDYLFSISTGEGAVKIKEAELALKRAKKAYKDTETSYDAMIKQITGNTKEDKEAKENLINQKNKELAALQMSIDIANNDYKAADQKYDEEGNNKVVAGKSGTIEDIYAKVGDRVEADYASYSISGEAGKLLQVYMEAPNDPSKKYFFDANDSGDYGEEVTIEVSGATYVGNVVANFYDMFYVKLKNNPEVMTYGGIASFKIYNMKNSIFIEEKQYHSDIQIGSEDKFVWIERNGYPMKQYITLEESYVMDLGGGMTQLAKYNPYLEQTGKLLVLYGLNENDKIY